MFRALTKTEAESIPTAIMVRQPIYDAELKVVSYKILYKDVEVAASTLLGDSEFAVQVMLEEYTSVFEAGEIKRLPAFIALPLGTATELRGSVNEGEIYVELDAGSASESAFLPCLKHLTEQGFKVVLGNYGFSELSDEIINLVSVVRLDVHGMSREQVEEQMMQLRCYEELLLLGERIDSVEVLEQCVELGFDLFQGQFLSKPRAMSDGKISANQTAVLQLIAELQDPNTTPEALEKIVEMDPVLTYKLLRIVNSAAYSLVREVTSIADTIVMLGFEQVKQLAIVISTSVESGKPMEMSRSMLIRGRMCEAVARQQDPGNKSAYFLAGTMSGLHLLLDTTQENLMKQLPVSDDIRAAILEGEGVIGKVLKNASHYEAGSWDDLSEEIDFDLYESAYMDGIRWVNEIMGSAI